MTALAIPRLRPFSSHDEAALSNARPWHRPHLSVVDEAPATPRSTLRWRGPTPTEPVETLSLPDGLHEDMLPHGAAPSGEHQTRVWMIRAVRDLGREYRATYGMELRTDASAIEQMQSHLVTSVAKLAGWTNLDDPRPWNWELAFPSGDALSPVVRVRRFVEKGMRETDLVALFLELDAASR
jgi:hypothetical protein